MPIPDEPKIYHIVHIDRLASIVGDDCLWCDAKMAARAPSGTTIGMNSIKERRLTNTLNSHPDVCVGKCVPFYFCPRSVMLYVISQANHLELEYRGGQGPIGIWKQTYGGLWLGPSKINGVGHLRPQMPDLDSLTIMPISPSWTRSTGTPCMPETGKQAEFLLEASFPWEMVSRIGVNSKEIYAKVQHALRGARHRPTVEVRPDWYY